MPARDGSVLVDLGALRKVIRDASCVVTVEPGVTQGMLAEFLRRRPPTCSGDGAGPTNLLANALERGYGVTPHVDHFAAVTDIEAVLPDGTLYRTALRELGRRSGPLVQVVSARTTGLFSGWIRIVTA